MSRPPTARVELSAQGFPAPAMSSRPVRLGAPLRLLSSTWKQTRDADRFANMAVADGLRSRAAYKLTDMDARFGRFLRRGARVVDLGAAPGGFAAVAAPRLHLDASPAGPRWAAPGPFGYEQPAVRAPRETQRTMNGLQKRRKFGEVRTHAHPGFGGCARTCAGLSFAVA